MVATRFAVAIHILLFLACRAGGGPATSGLIAASVNTNAVVVRRIMGQLARAGLVRVQRGRGGAMLARVAGSITLCDVWRAMTPDGPMLRMHAPGVACPVGQQVQGVLDETFAAVERAMLERLEGTSLADLAGKIRPGGMACAATQPTGVQTQA